MRWMTSSTATPSDWAVKLVISRWRRIGSATAATSPAPTWKFPLRMAWALAARTRFMLARGPAPQVSHLLTKSAASGVPGRRVADPEILGEAALDHDARIRDHLARIPAQRGGAGAIV